MENVKKKRVGIVLFLLIGVILSILVFRTGFYREIKKMNFSLESLCENGAVIYDSEGKIYTKLDIRKCAEWISYEKIPEKLREVIEGEKRISYGKLIIEQFKPKEKNKWQLRKALEGHHTEEEIEEFFWNTMYFGNGVYGINSASKYFFGCEFEQISETEIEFLGHMVETCLTEKNYEIRESEIYEDSMLYAENGYIDGVVREAAARLIYDGVDEMEAYNMLFLNDLHIYTYLDSSIQDELEKLYEKKETFTKNMSKEECVQSGAVVMDRQGNVCAIASGNSNDRIFNRAVSKKNQVGSTIKPVSTYSLAIEDKLVHFSSKIENRQLIKKKETGEEYAWPSNNDGEYGGKVTVTKALQESKNTIAVQIGTMVGEERMFDFLRKQLGWELIYYESQNSDCQLAALSLGYLYKGITLEKLTSSYEMFINNGKFYGAATISRMENSKKEEILSDKRKGRQVLSEESAFIMNRLLYNNVYGEYGIAKDAAVENVEVIGKTGTTGNEEGQSISRLFVGGSPDYLVGVWVGYDDKRSLKMKVYNNPDEIFVQIMSQLSSEKKEYLKPEGVIEKEYCEVSGKLASEKCIKVEKGYYTEDNMPEKCDECQKN